MTKRNDQRILNSFIKLLYKYFGSRSDYLIEWLSRVVQGMSVNRALMINDCSFSHAFTKKFIRLLQKVSDTFKILYLIREERQPPMNKSEGLLSLDLLHMMVTHDITKFGLRWGSLMNSNCIIVNPYSNYLHHEVNSSGCFVVINVTEMYRSLSLENKIIKKYIIIKHSIDLPLAFKEFLMLYHPD